MGFRDVKFTLVDHDCQLRLKMKKSLNFGRFLKKIKAFGGGRQVGSRFVSLPGVGHRRGAARVVTPIERISRPGHQQELLLWSRMAK